MEPLPEVGDVPGQEGFVEVLRWPDPTAADEPNICDLPVPRVRFRSFGDSGLNFELMGWIPEPVLRGRTPDFGANLYHLLDYKSFG